LNSPLLPKLTFTKNPYGDVLPLTGGFGSGILIVFSPEIFDLIIVEITQELIFYCLIQNFKDNIQTQSKMGENNLQALFA
jgi:hypothetical protein